MTDLTTATAAPAPAIKHEFGSYSNRSNAVAGARSALKRPDAQRGVDFDVHERNGRWVYVVLTTPASGPVAAGGPGLARLRANADTEALRQDTLKQQEAARAKVPAATGSKAAEPTPAPDAGKAAVDLDLPADGSIPACLRRADTPEARERAARIVAQSDPRTRVIKNPPDAKAAPKASEAFASRKEVTAAALAALGKDAREDFDFTVAKCDGKWRWRRTAEAAGITEAATPAATPAKASRKRGESKLDVVEQMLRREDGATHKELSDFSGWRYVNMKQLAEQREMKLVCLDAQTKRFKLIAADGNTDAEVAGYGARRQVRHAA